MSTPLPEQVATAIAGAAVTGDRNVTIFGADFTPEQLKAFSQAISDLATKANTALVHQAGDLFVDRTGVGYVSDGANLWRIGPNAVAAPAPYWLKNGTALTVVRTSAGNLLGDVIRAALA